MVAAACTSRYLENNRNDNIFVLHYAIEFKNVRENSFIELLFISTVHFLNFLYGFPWLEVWCIMLLFNQRVYFHVAKLSALASQ